MICSRRALLGGMGLAGLGVLAPALTGCSSEPEQLVIAASQVPLGSGVIAGGYVVTQLTEGEFITYNARCPHADVQVTSVSGDQIHCKPHDAWFDAATGAPISGPTEDSMTTVPVVRDGDDLVVGFAPAK